MCNPLTVSCIHQTGTVIYATNHQLTLPELKTPCKTPGSLACKAGIAELQDCYNAPTSCAGEHVRGCTAGKLLILER